MAKIWKCPLQRRNRSRFSWPEATANLSIWPASWPAKFTILKSVIGMPNRKDNSTEYKLYYIDKCLRLGLHITTLQWNKKNCKLCNKKNQQSLLLASVLRPKSYSSYESKCLSMFGYFLVGHSLLRCASFSTVSASTASAESRFLFSETISPLPLKCASDDSLLEAWTTSTFLAKHAIMGKSRTQFFFQKTHRLSGFDTSYVSLLFNAVILYVY